MDLVSAEAGFGLGVSVSKRPHSLSIFLLRRVRFMSEFGLWPFRDDLLFPGEQRLLAVLRSE